jgi:hypothetical protein
MNCKCADNSYESVITDYFGQLHGLWANNRVAAAIKGAAIVDSEDPRFLGYEEFKEFMDKLTTNSSGKDTFGSGTATHDASSSDSVITIAQDSIGAIMKIDQPYDTRIWGEPLATFDFNTTDTVQYVIWPNPDAKGIVMVVLAAALQGSRTTLLQGTQAKVTIAQTSLVTGAVITLHNLTERHVRLATAIAENKKLL